LPSMERPSAKALTVLLVLFGVAPPGDSQAQLPTAATTATVTTDALSVFADMNRSSEVVRSLAKGDSVYVDLRIDQGGMKWCGVRLTGQSTRIGFVDCRSVRAFGLPGDSFCATRRTDAKGVCRRAVSSCERGRDRFRLYR